jgi:hypothetical protein
MFFFCSHKLFFSLFDVVWCSIHVQLNVIYQLALIVDQQGQILEQLKNSIDTLNIVNFGYLL